MATIFKTRGIVLRTVRYGETSLIVAILTEQFGLQSYLVNGVRAGGKKGSAKQSMFQPTALLQLVVYHNELKQLQRIKEVEWAVLYQQIFSNVLWNAVALFMSELLSKCVKQPEPNPELFQFCEDAFMQLDKSDATVMANFSMFFAVHLTFFFGFRPTDNFSENNCYFDLQEGCFVEKQPNHPAFLEHKQAAAISLFLKAMQPHELIEIKLNHDFRRTLLFSMEKYYALHITDFGTLRTLPVLKSLLS